MGSNMWPVQSGRQPPATECSATSWLSKTTQDALDAGLTFSPCRCALAHPQSCPAARSIPQPFSNQTRVNHLWQLSRQLESYHGSRCRTVAYQVAFGAKYVQQSHSRAPLHLCDSCCFFRIVLGNDSSPPVISHGNSFVLGLDASLLLFGGSHNIMRRNVKVFKLLGTHLFAWAKWLVWIDSKLDGDYQRNNERLNAMKNYVQRSRRGRDNDGVCAVFIGLPAHPHAFGKGELDPSRLTLQLHAKTIRESNMHRNTTDDVTLVERQIDAYFVGKGSNAKRGLQLSLIDSAFFVRNHQTAECAAFNAQLGCAWLNEVSCYSDRDQLSFPAVVSSTLQLATRDVPAAQLFGRNAKDRLFRDRSGKPCLAVLAPQRGAQPLHWYYK